MFRSCLKSAYDRRSAPDSIRNNKELYQFAEKYVAKQHGRVRFEYNFMAICDSVIETGHWDLKLLDKKSKLPIKTKADGSSSTLHLLEAICSLQFDNGYLTASTNYEHLNGDKWSFVE